MMPKIPLKAIVLVHFVLTIWATQASWISPAYAYMNFFVLAVGIWAVAAKESIDSILMFLVMMFVSILLDMILIGVYYSRGYQIYEVQKNPYVDEFRFSVGMAILNLLLKPLTCVLLYHQYRERGGDYNVGLPNSNAPTGYENIDQPIPSNSQKY
ncbi:type-1 angiotensin II receptor-associated protein-like isoform X2 [Ptychodera flava]|uniref:type-1 angiotensin II receptor-associated protein-like isoform X2 n=1 Tax=Ptychodera flava TaxID=63121 RepID=UPI00396A1293